MKHAYLARFVLILAAVAVAIFTFIKPTEKF